MTNREYMIGLLTDDSFIDDGGASYEAMVYYNIDCPYFSLDKRCLCLNKGIERKVCFECKAKWLESEVEE